MNNRTIAGADQAVARNEEAGVWNPDGSKISPTGCAPELEPAEFIAFWRCQDLLRTRLTEKVVNLFAELSAMPLHVHWHGPLDFRGPGSGPVLCPWAKSRAVTSSRRREECEACLRHRWESASSPAEYGQLLSGPCGLSSFYAAVQMGDAHLLTLVLQTEVAAQPSKGLTPVSPPRLRAKSATPAVSPPAFDRGIALIRLLYHDLTSTTQSVTPGRGLEHAMRGLCQSLAEVERLRAQPSDRPRSIQDAGTSTGSKSHAHKLVGSMLDYLHQHYHRPISLTEFASAMKMNASYLSAVFSQTTGVTFHRFLEELRMAKAKELLQDPRNRVGEVANAVGYSSMDSFRHAFRRHEGLSPEAWRGVQ